MVDYSGLIGVDIFKNEIESIHKIEKTLGYSTYSNALVLPCRELSNGESGGGIEDELGVFLSESTIHAGSHIAYDVSSEDITISDDEVIFFGMLIGIWGHCITDCVKRAWFFYAEKFQEIIGHKKVVYIAPHGSMHQNFIDFLNMINIDIDSFTCVDRPTKFKRIIVPDSSFFLDNSGVEHFTNEYIDTINLVKSKFVSGTEAINKKIFYSHRNVRGINNDIGEDKLERFFQDNGFEIVHPEKLTVEKQLRLLSQCAIFAASDGSSSHNSIFLPPNAEVIIIPRSPYLTFHQLALNELYETQKIFYIDSTLSIMCKGDRPTRGPFFYYVSPELIEHIEKKEFAINDKWLKENFKDFKPYIKRGFYVEDNRCFTARTPYSERALYYYNKYLFLGKYQTTFVKKVRMLSWIVFRAKKKIFKLFD